MYNKLLNIMANKNKPKTKGDKDKNKGDTLIDLLGD